MVQCCCNHRDLHLILNEGFTFTKQNLEWFTQLFHELKPADKTSRRDIKWIRGYCYITKLTNKSHLKGISMEHLVEFKENSSQKYTWTLLISLTSINKTKNVFFIKEDYVIKLVKLFINRTNSTNYNGTFQLTFATDILIHTILYIIQRSNHQQTSHCFSSTYVNRSMRFHKRHIFPSDIFEYLKTFTLSRQIIHLGILYSETIWNNNIYPANPIASTWNNSYPTN